MLNDGKKLIRLLINIFLGIQFHSLYSQDYVSLKNNETNLSDDYIGFYQKYISNIRGQSCPMFPSCSRYGLESFRNNNFFNAFLSTSDRLIRCGHDYENYSVTLTNDGIKFLDIPENSNNYKFSDLVYKRERKTYAYGDNFIDDPNLKFIKKLINEGYKREALIEINRFEVFKGELTKELYLNKILILNDIGEYEKGIYEFEKFKYLNFNGDPEILLQISLLYKKLGNFKTSLTYVDKAIKVKDLPIFIYDKLFKLQGVLYAMDDNWESAYSSFLKMNDKNQSQELIKIIESNNTIKYKNPKTAMFLSIVPGAGYYYTGNNQTALSSLLVNGLLVYATTSNIKNDNIGMSLLTGVFSLSFYISNIQGAFKSAKNFNSRKRNLIKSKLNSKL
jgi:putative component of membrane protein insertase Oxa1/YidC/SpoIIIJ protein YidD